MAAIHSDVMKVDDAATVSCSGRVDRRAVRELREHILANHRRGLVIDLTEASPVDDATARHLRRQLRRAVGRRDVSVLSDDLDLRIVLEGGWPPNGLVVRPAPPGHAVERPAAASN